MIDRPHTIAEIEAGIVALPAATIAEAQSSRDTTFDRIGDATFQTGLHLLYRWNRSFAAGAGIMFSPFPTSSELYGGVRGLSRTQSRSYFFIGGELRFIPLHYRFFEGWIGASVGGIVVADRFRTNGGDDVAPIVGSKESTVRSEGFAFGAQLGGNYFLSENWIVGANSRIYQWMLPSKARCSSLGDCATLTGAVQALEFGLTIAYRLPL